MLIKEIKNYLFNKRQSDLEEISYHLNRDKEVVLHALNFLIQKGMIKRESLKTNNKGCFKCYCCSKKRNKIYKLLWIGLLNSIKHKTIDLKIKYADFKKITRSKTINYYTDNIKDIFRISGLLLKKSEVSRKEIRLIGISVSNFEFQKNRDQLELL